MDPALNFQRPHHLLSLTQGKKKKKEYPRLCANSVYTEGNYEFVVNPGLGYLSGWYPGWGYLNGMKQEPVTGFIKGGALKKPGSLTKITEFPLQNYSREDNCGGEFSEVSSLQAQRRGAGFVIAKFPSRL